MIEIILVISSSFIIMTIYIVNKKDNDNGKIPFSDRLKIKWKYQYWLYLVK
jgi:hypothetical protein